MAGNESQSNKKIWFFVVTVLAVLALTGCFILYKYIQNNNKNSNNSKKMSGKVLCCLLAILI